MGKCTTRKRKCAWLAVDGDGVEYIYTDAPWRNLLTKKWYVKGGDRYSRPTSVYASCMRLPKGWIEHITGKILKWHNDPLRLYLNTKQYELTARRIGWITD